MAKIKWTIWVVEIIYPDRLEVEIEDRGISEELQSDEQGADRRFSFRCHLQLLALSAVQSGCISSWTSSGTRISSQYTIMYLTYTWYCSTCS